MYEIKLKKALVSILLFQVAIKIIDKTQLNPGSLQKVRLFQLKFVYAFLTYIVIVIML